MKEDIARLRKFTSQMNVWIDDDLKERLKVLKDEYGVDIAEETRKSLKLMVYRLEKAVSRTA